MIASFSRASASIVHVMPPLAKPVSCTTDSISVELKLKRARHSVPLVQHLVRKKSLETVSLLNQSYAYVIKAISVCLLCENLERSMYHGSLITYEVFQ
jgi:hypothetical protein